LTDKCLGTHWWTFASLEELDGVRLRAWRTQKAEEWEAEYYEHADTNIKDEIDKGRQKYGRGPTTTGEAPGMLAMESEEANLGEIVFEVS
jgi:hypothetical protein